MPAPRSNPLLRHAAGQARPHPWPRAVDDSTFNPTVQQRRIALLVEESANTLQAIARRAHEQRAKTCHMEQLGGIA